MNHVFFIELIIGFIDQTKRESCAFFVRNLPNLPSLPFFSIEKSPVIKSFAQNCDFLITASPAGPRDILRVTHGGDKALFSAVLTGGSGFVPAASP